MNMVNPRPAEEASKVDTNTGAAAENGAVSTGWGGPHRTARAVPSRHAGRGP